MKQLKFLFLSFVLCAFMCASCADFSEPLFYTPTVSTGLVEGSTITRTGGTLTGIITSSDVKTINRVGFRYSIYESMEVATEIITELDGRHISASLSGLEPGRTYYYYAFASGGFNEVRGDVLSFSTQHYGAPLLSHMEYSEMYAGTISVSARLADDGGIDLKNAGFLYCECPEGTQIPSPDVSSGKWQLVSFRDYASLRNGSAFSADLSLAADTEYAIVAFASNSDGQTGYSQSVRLKNRGYTEVYKRIYNEICQNGPFPFYPMDGCGNQPSIVNGVLHYVPTGQFTQFFIDNPIYPSRSGDYAIILRIKSNKEGAINLMTQNGWDDSENQRINSKVCLATEWKDVLIKLDGITCKPS